MLRSSPVMMIWLVIVIGAFVYAASNNYITIFLDEKTFILIILFLILFAIINSFKNLNIIPLLIKFSKSKTSNRSIYTRFFIKKAFSVNVLLIIFIIVAAISFRNPLYIPIFILIIILSVMISFFTMYIKFLYSNKTVKKDKIKKKIFNPLIKSVLHEYLTPDFIILAVLSVFLFVIILIECFINGSFNDIKTQFFIYTIIAFSIGLAGIIDSIYNINWKFQTIIFNNDFKYNFKRTVIFLVGIFGLIFLIIIFSGIIVNFILLLKYLFCIFTILTVTINIAFIKINILIRFIIVSINIILTVWISALHYGFLLVLIIPVIISFVKAKSEYREWTYL